MPSRALIPALAAATLLLTTACGGVVERGAATATATASAATIVPASAAGFVAIATDLDSDQWAQVTELADAFPGRQGLVDLIDSELAGEDVDVERDVEPALGPEVALVFLEEKDAAIALTQPEDRAKLDALLAKSDEPTVQEEIDGWTAIAETQAQLDAFKLGRSAGRLSDHAAFREAFRKLSGDALVKAYGVGDELAGVAASASGLLQGRGTVVWTAASLEAVDGGLQLDGFVRTDGASGGEPYEPKLLERIPSGALAVISFRDLGSTLRGAEDDDGEGEEGLPDLEGVLGVTLDDLAVLFEGETAIYVRSGVLIPEVTIVTEAADSAEALATIDRLAERVAVFGSGTGGAEVDGVQTRYVDVGGVRVTYAAFDGLAVVTTRPGAIRDLREGGGSLTDDDDFERASEAAGLGDSTSGFVYVDLAEAVPLLEGFAGLAGEPLSPELSDNLEPLESVLVHASKDGNDIRFSGFLGVR